MPSIVNKNERSWAIDLISIINNMLQTCTLQIKRAGGETTINTGYNNRMFPDVILYGDNAQTHILQGWELKLPDTPITDLTFIKDAHRKAISLGLNSCFIWNFSSGVLYVKDNNGDFNIAKQWNETNFIQSRDDVNVYKNDWEQLLKSILIEINQYLINGYIQSSSLGKIISDTVVATLIIRNKSLVSEALYDASVTDARMKAFLDVWWSQVKTEYNDDETTLYNAYSKVIILNWTNRFLFAHLIKNTHNSASAIMSIDYDSTPVDANNIFSTITSNCDFYNIFAPIEYCINIPLETWIDLIDLNMFLIDNGINNITQTSLQAILESSVSTAKREAAGQFTTPLKLAEILSKITIIDWSKDCIDPCCGTGSISHVILKNKKNLLPIDQAIKTTWASDKYTYPLQIANISLTSYDSINFANRIFQHNILNLINGKKIKITDPATGNIIEVIVPLFSSIVSNLPFVPFENIVVDDIILINKTINFVTSKTNITLNGRSDLYFYIIFHLWNILDTDGTLGIITSNSWLGTKAGKDFFKALSMFYHVKQIHISEKERWFKNAQVVTVLTILSKREIIAEASDNETITFSKWKKTLYELEQNEELSINLINSSLLNYALNNEVVCLNKYSYAQTRSLIDMNISLNAFFHNIDWLYKIKDKLTPLKTNFDVFRGERRGWDDLFYPESGHTIESVYIKKVLKNARNVNNLITSADNDAFCCSRTIIELEQLHHHGALSWIERFETCVNGTGLPLPQVLSRSNQQWYEMKDTAIAEIFTTMNPDRRLFFARFDTPAFINQRLIGLKAKNPQCDIELCHALLNSLLGMFYIEAVGFGRGLGALDINSSTIKQIYMLDPSLIDNNSKVQILKSFSVITKRKILKTDEELEKLDRSRFDHLILNIYGIEKYYDNIKHSLLSMQEARLNVR